MRGVSSRSIFFLGRVEPFVVVRRHGAPRLLPYLSGRHVERAHLRASVHPLLHLGGIRALEEAFDRLYGFVSHPIPFRAGRRVAVRVVSQFGEESTKVLRP